VRLRQEIQEVLRRGGGELSPADGECGSEFSATNEVTRDALELG